MSDVGSPAMDKHPIQRRIEMLLVASCYRNQDKLQPDGPLSLYADFTFNINYAIYLTRITATVLKLHVLNLEELLENKRGKFCETSLK